MSRTSARQALHQAFERMEIPEQEASELVSTLLDRPESPGMDALMRRVEDISSQLIDLKIKMGVMEWTQRFTVLLLLGLFWLAWKGQGG